MNSYFRSAFSFPSTVYVLLLFTALSATPMVAHAADSNKPPSRPATGDASPTSTPEAFPSVSSIKDVQESLGQQRAISPAPPSPSSRSPDITQQLTQAANGCKSAYNRAYQGLLDKKQGAIQKAKQAIPQLQNRIADASSWVEKYRKLRLQVQEALAQNDIRQKSLRQEIASLEKLQSEESHFAVHGKAWTDRQAKVDLLNSQLAKSRDEHTQLQSREAWLNKEIQIQLAEQVNSEASLTTLQTRIAEEESAMKGKIQGVIEAHRQKRFAEIEKLRQNGELGALKRCAEQDSPPLDDLMRTLFP
jgi:hypothetical protein